ncbi:expressed unknown protein [Seminavis robusta]|uniref:Uncharacterized protein n=1 Tax=Seminavis robusta TaxID=568900 RepID=A0A9N8D5H1_9STRA|nr:expressed unknown protein [Seminavis robusta]|eukprot:Sro9_g007390.1 n/a (127) ;mRNA; r:134448-134828
MENKDPQEQNQPVSLESLDDDGMDLYGDLIEDTQPTAASNTASKAAPNDGSSNDHHQKQQNPKSLSLADHIKELETQLAASQKENETLKRNMGTLYRTAKNEIDSKNSHIELLTKQLDQFQNASYE